MSKTLVVAANNGENTDWTEQVKGWNVEVYTHYHPPGRDADTHLRYITLYYNELPDEVVIAQGYPFDHDPEFITHLDDPAIRYYGMVERCQPDGMPRVEWTPLDCWCQMLGLPVQPSYIFVGGMQYRLTKEQIQSRSLDFYKALYYLSKIQDDRSGYEPHWCVPESRSAYILERILPLIWNVKL